MSSRKKDDAQSSTASTGKPHAESVREVMDQLHQRKSWGGLVRPVGRFLLTVLISIGTSSALFALTSGITLDGLKGVSKDLEAGDVGGLLAWKAVEVGVPWILGYDSNDVSDYVWLIHYPTFLFLSAFYFLRPTTILVSCFIVLFSTTLPFSCLRRPTSIRSLFRTNPPAVYNRAILQDIGITIYTIAVATAIYTVVLYISAETWLPAKLVVHFEGIRDMTKIHQGPAGLPVVFASLLPTGVASRDFLFVSSTGSSSKHVKPESSSPKEGEYLACTVFRKTWGTLSTKTKILLSRMLVLSVMIVANTTVQLVTTVKGADVAGAALWGSTWAAANVIVGLTYCWIEAVDGV